MTTPFAQLEISGEKDSNFNFALDGSVIGIGRASDNTLVLNQPSVSRHHARLSQESGRYRVVDLGSSSGTQINDTQLSPDLPMPLANGDIIHIGIFRLQFFTEETVVQPISLSKSKTVAFAASRPPVLEVTTPQGSQIFSLEGNMLVIGRDPASDILIEAPVVSAKHAQLRQWDQGYEIVDLDSRNGLNFEGRRIKHKPLANGDVLQIGSTVSLMYRTAPITEMAAPAQFINQDSDATVALSPGQDLASNVIIKHLDLRGRDTLTLGRDRQNDTCIEHPTVSRYHALIARQDGSFYIADLKSSNGTFVNGKQIVGKRRLRPGDTIRIGPCRLVFNVDETLVHHNEAGNLCLDGVNLTKVVGKGTTLIDDVSVSVLPREFVAILGMSGSGKSTLLDALNGLRPATSGTVLVNGLNLYRHFHAYSTQLGYVPQKNIIHEELTVAEALDFTAQLRMPSDTSQNERRQRIQEVLRELGLTHRQSVPIKLLSGGQQRRVCIGVELLTKPSLFFLDEATSGLDPGTEADMMSLLRQLADQGRTILLVTHATQNIRECDLVIFMAEGGRLAYYGPSDLMLDYFQTSFQEEFQGMKLQDFSDVYRVLDPEKNPRAPSAEMLQDKYRQSSLHQQYVTNRQSIPTKQKQHQRQTKNTRPSRQRKSRISPWRQFAILSARNLAVMARDRTNLLLILTIAPLLGLLDFFTWKRYLFSPGIIRSGVEGSDLSTTGSAANAITMIFLSALIAVMIGAMTTMRELVKEEGIYRREHMIGLQIFPYILSKVWIAGLLAIYQGATFLLVKKLAVDIPGGLEITLQVYITITLAIFGGMIMGLLVSAIAPNQNMAPLLLLLLLVPQIIFSGGLQPISGQPGEFISRLTVIKWPFETLVTLSGMGRDVATDPCWTDPETQQPRTETFREELTPSKLDQCQCLGPNVFKSCNFPGIRAYYDPAVDQPEPAQPNRADYQDPATYQQALEDWQQQIATWQKNRNKSLNGSAGLIDRFNQARGFMFDLDTPRQWGNLGLVILGMLALIPIAQRRKNGT